MRQVYFCDPGTTAMAMGIWESSGVYYAIEHQALHHRIDLWIGKHLLWSTGGQPYVHFPWILHHQIHRECRRPDWRALAHCPEATFAELIL